MQSFLDYPVKVPAETVYMKSSEAFYFLSQSSEASATCILIAVLLL